MQQQTLTYHQQGQRFLRQAHEELPSDLPQASEKAWGAAAQMVKAIAEQRGWPHRGHRELQHAVNQFVQETGGDSELAILFDAAAQLHRNFYENWLSRERVALGIAAVERFVARMERLLPRP